VALIKIVVTKPAIPKYSTSKMMKILFFEFAVNVNNNGDIVITNFIFLRSKNDKKDRIILFFIANKF